MNKLKFNYSKLRGKIKEVFETQEAFAKAMAEQWTKIMFNKEEKLK